ncbi:MAG: glycosyltransferase family 2 protein [Candidatus Diapherotrites archaeon]|nr:glycosyltransferase family 2 protein [Candidatus Diapherotrites archaeon]
MLFKKVGIFVPSYKSFHTLENVIQRVPDEIKKTAAEIFVIDDASPDQSYENALEVQKKLKLKNLVVLKNEKNLGFGGNHKVAFQYAIRKNFDVVVTLHGDGQYAPEKIPELLESMEKNNTEIATVSRFLDNPQGKGMPRWRFFSNRFLNFLQKKILGFGLSDHNVGMRSYRVWALEKIPFERLSDDYYFDTELLSQCRLAGFRISEIPIQTVYDKYSHSPGYWKTFKFFLGSLHTLLDYRLALLGFGGKKYGIKNFKREKTH